MSQDEVMAADAAAIRKFLSRFNKDGLVDVASAIGVELTPTMKGLQKGKLLDEVVATFVRGFFWYIPFVLTGRCVRVHVVWYARILLANFSANLTHTRSPLDICWYFFYYVPFPFFWTPHHRTSSPCTRARAFILQSSCFMLHALCTREIVRASTKIHPYIRPDACACFCSLLCNCNSFNTNTIIYIYNTMQQYIFCTGTRNQILTAGNCRLTL